MTSAGERLERLLALLPYLVSHPGARVAEVAGQFGVSERQIRDDLNLAFLCGLPGYTPGDLIEVEFGGDGTVMVGNADTLARPLRLTTDEALALVVALRTLADLPGAADDAVLRALAKVEAAAGSAATGSERVAVTVESEPAVVAVLRSALAAGHRVRLSYWSPARDETTERDVDPLQLLVTGGRTYLWGWCRRVRDLRTFRTDRIVAARELDEPADPPAEARSSPLPAALFTPSQEDRLVTLRLERSARWVAEYYPCEVLDEDDTGLTVTLRSRQMNWLVRLVLRLGTGAAVLGPPELAAAVAAEAGAALANYPR